MSVSEWTNCRFVDYFSGVLFCSAWHVYGIALVAPGELLLLEEYYSRVIDQVVFNPNASKIKRNHVFSPSPGLRVEVIAWS